MIISILKGGFGNQLFMYACAYAIARRTHQKLVVDATYLSTDALRNYELDGLSIQYDCLLSIKKGLPYTVKVGIRKMLHVLPKILIREFKEKKCFSYDKEIERLNESRCLNGYWQSEKYFSAYRQEILKMLSPSYKVSCSFDSMLKKIEESNSVSVHIRRGDYKALGICLKDSYYENAVKFVKERIPNPRFFVFSDDLDYARKLFGRIGLESFEIAEYKAVNSTIEDLLLMKACHHNIIANSSYSWWGAWANEHSKKYVIAPKRKVNDDLYPDEWVQIE